MTDESSGDSLATRGLNLVGKEFANYRILSELGRGGMAIVYKADELSLNRVVALKVMSPKISEDETMVKRFSREAQAAARLSHPNIIHIYAIGEENGTHFFTMEYVKGKTLKDLRKERGRLGAAEAVPLMIQAAEALAEAHRAGLVHRDIKPSNIMVDAAGRVKVTDFGIARVAEATTQLTVDGAFLGTPQYMSPEQCEGKNVDGRSDIYSLGITFYELLTGRIPYEAETPASILVKVLKGDLKPVRDVVSSVPASVEAVLQKMLALDREQRYRDADELTKALKQLALAPDEATAVTMAAPTLATSAAAVPPAVPAVPSPAPAAPPAGADRPPELRAKPADKPRGRLALGIAAVVVLALVAAAVVYGLVGKKFSRRPRITVPDEFSEPAATAVETSGGTAPAQAAASGAGAQAVETARSHRENAAASAAETPPEDPQKPAVSPAQASETGPGIAAGEPVKNETAGEAAPALSGAAQPAAGGASREAAAAGPDSDTIVVTLTGGDDKAPLAAAEAELALTEKGLVVIDRGAAEGKKLADVAAMNLVISFTQTGITELQYFGRTAEQYTVVITMKIVDCASGRAKAGPSSVTVQYTALTAQDVLGKAARKLAEELHGQLK